METLRPVPQAGSTEQLAKGARADALDAFGMVGASPPFRALSDHIQRAAAGGRAG